MLPTFSLPLADALAARDEGALCVDARTPQEYASGTIPGAVSLPLLSAHGNEMVGQAYHNQGPLAARRLGVDLVAPQLPALMAQLDGHLQEPQQKILVFCWRGGLRSQALTTLLRLAGYQAWQITGGHKAFRRHVLTFLEKRAWGRMLVLRGLTGVGKTYFLHRLAAKGYPVLDLEGLARHRGSAFGSIGCQEQPSQKQFEALLWDVLRHIPADGYVVTEGESRHIGRIQLPKTVHAALQEEVSIWLNASMAFRLAVLQQDYNAQALEPQQVVSAIEAIRKRLGGKRVAALTGLAWQRRWSELMQALIQEYYDPLYSYSCPSRRIEVDMEPENLGLERIEQAIANVLRHGPAAHRASA